MTARDVTQASRLSRRTGILPGRKRAGSPRDEFVRTANWEACTTCQARHGESVLWRTGSLSYSGCGYATLGSFEIE